jgi:hypothetical protein
VAALGTTDTVIGGEASDVSALLAAVSVSEVSDGEHPTDNAMSAMYSILM